MSPAGIAIRALTPLLLWSLAASADVSGFQGARVVERSGNSTDVEFAFAENVRATSREATDQGVEIRLRGTSASSEWENRDERYTGELGPVAAIRFEGSGVRGYQLAVELTRQMPFEVLPQSDPRRLTIRFTDSSAAVHEATAADDRTEASLGTDDAVAADRDPSAPMPGAILPAAALPSAASTAVAAENAVGPNESTKALEEGRQAAMGQDYPKAIVLFTKAAQSSSVPVRQEALEMLGAARERNHQDAQAKVVYEQFLAQYPDAEQAPRIRQRLSGLLTRNLPTQPKLKVAAREETSMWSTSGNVAQFYMRTETAVNNEQSVVGVNGLFTNADVIVNRRSDPLNLQMRVTSNGLYDFSSDGDSTYQMTTAYIDAQQVDWGVNVRIGRQSQQSNGVLGRFDGAQVQYKANPWLRFGVLGGYAVDYGANAFSDERPLYGLNADLSLFSGMLDFAPYYITQNANGLLDRRAVGLETRFFRNNLSVFSLLDYDTYHEVWNTNYVMVNLRFDNGLSTYATFDHRRSPYITTENALIGQGVASLGSLENTFTNQQIQQLADDRTAELTMATLGADKDVTSRLQIGTDVSYSDFSSTPASGNVTATPSQQDYYYTLRFQLNEAYGAQTFAALHLRYADGNDYRTSSVFLNNRFTFGSAWQLYPRFRVDYTELSGGQSQWYFEPSLRLDFRPRQNMWLEFESGYENTQRDMPLQSLEVVGYYIRVGYRSLF